MDKGQLIKDIFTLNFKTFGTRYHKLVAVLKRKFILPSVNFSTAKNIYDVPIIINNWNRLTMLKQLVDWLQKAGYKNIIILDNDSSYQPLLKYYDETTAKVIYLKKNFGYMALWKSGLYKEFYTDFYVYTDPDILPVESCPADFMSHFMQLLINSNNVEKVGFGLKIDDLPDHYDKKKEVILWEKKYWEKEVKKDVYDAQIDTTFALYKPYTIGDIWVQNSLRTGGNYMAKHLPWYEDSKNPDKESIFYANNIKKGASHWISNDK